MRFLHFQLYASLDLATYLINEKRATLQAYEDQWHAKISIVPCSHLESPHYQLKHTRYEADTFQQLNQLATYKLIPTLNNEVTILRPSTKAADAPVITQFLGGETTTPPHGHRRSSGLIKRLFKRMFGQGKTTAEMPLETPRQEKRTSQSSQHRRRRNVTTRTPAASGTRAPEEKEPRGDRGENRNRSRRHRYRQRDGQPSSGASEQSAGTSAPSSPAPEKQPHTETHSSES